MNCIHIWPLWFTGIYLKRSDKLVLRMEPGANITFPKTYNGMYQSVEIRTHDPHTMFCLKEVERIHGDVHLHALGKDIFDSLFEVISD